MLKCHRASQIDLSPGLALRQCYGRQHIPKKGSHAGHVEAQGVMGTGHGSMMKRSIMLLVLSAITLSAADISGTWKASAKSTIGGGTIKRTFFFKQDGTKLTGTSTSDRWPRSAIENGRIEGDTLSFTLTVDIEFGNVKISFTGKVQGDVINMTAETDGKPFDFIAKRAAPI